MLKEQIFCVKEFDPNLAQNLANGLKTVKELSSFQEIDRISFLLAKRGIVTIEEAKQFLFPDWNHCYDPFLLKDMDKAIGLIQSAVDNHEKIMIYGDYDVDGITSTSILVKALSHLSPFVEYYIPDRMEEGYGINEGAIENIVKLGAKLLISVDTGITAISQVDKAKSLGLNVIITDHHECQEEVPKADAVINPKQIDCQYPFKSLAGVGVTYKLIQALAQRFNYPTGFVEELVEIVAVGTIADIVTLVDENRIFVYQAFLRYQQVKNIGLQALFQVAQIKPEKISAGTIGFQIGPRLNAAGRLGDAKRGVQLFLSQDAEEALCIAQELDDENKNRREMEERILREADAIILSHPEYMENKILVIAHEGWHHGVIGIVASRITEKYYRPTILLTIEEGIASGSARSVEGFSIFDALYENKELMLKFGGHEMAAGMSLEEKNVERLREALQEYALHHMKEDTLIMKVRVDEIIAPDEISVKMIEELSLLEPYGMGNEEPKFLIQGRLSAIRSMGSEGQHIKLTVTNNTKKLDLIAFHRKDLSDELEEAMEIQAVGTLQVNEWKELKNPQLIVKAVQYGKSMTACLADLTYLFSQPDVRIDDLENKEEIEREIQLGSFSRVFFVEVYKKMKSLFQNDTVRIEFLELDQMITDRSKSKEIKILMIALAVKVFSEIDVFAYDIQKHSILILRFGSTKKAELQQSKLYNCLCKA